MRIALKVDISYFSEFVHIAEQPDKSRLRQLIIFIPLFLSIVYFTKKKAKSPS
ncbi:hypothetical protein HMPREF1150_0524 [Streptococcus sp. AS14]|nr:hypothetical protein HMPREF1150_0524 [Streptococcus sp. AS14]RRC90638.1 MFS transporter [Streptococcus sanguinis]